MFKICETLQMPTRPVPLFTLYFASNISLVS